MKEYAIYDSVARLVGALMEELKAKTLRLGQITAPEIIPLNLNLVKAEVEKVYIIASAQTHDGSNTFGVEVKKQNGDSLQSGGALVLNTAGGWAANTVLEIPVDQNLQLDELTNLNLHITDAAGTTATVTNLTTYVKYKLI